MRRRSRGKSSARQTQFIPEDERGWGEKADWDCFEIHEASQVPTVPFTISTFHPILNTFLHLMPPFAPSTPRDYFFPPTLSSSSYSPLFPLLLLLEVFFLVLRAFQFEFYEDLECEREWSVVWGLKDMIRDENEKYDYNAQKENPQIDFFLFVSHFTRRRRSKRENRIARVRRRDFSLSPTLLKNHWRKLYKDFFFSDEEATYSKRWNETFQVPFFFSSNRVPPAIN
jgi:hypothetical protein